MTITPATLFRASGVAATLAGLIFVGVQINHPRLDATSITTGDVIARNLLKLCMAALALAGLTGMYLRQVTKIGFLGLLHMDIVQERLEREYNLELVTSAPTVVYEVARTDGKVEYVDNPAKLPPQPRQATLDSPRLLVTDRRARVLQLLLAEERSSGFQS